MDHNDPEFSVLCFGWLVWLDFFDPILMYVFPSFTFAKFLAFNLHFMKHLFCLLFCLNLFSAQAQYVDWSRQFTGTGDASPTESTRDAQGNYYFCGNFMGVFDADPGPGVSSLNAGGSFDIYFLKLDPQFNFLWVKHITSNQPESANVIKIDQQGNILVAGTFNGTVDFDPGPDVHNLVEVGNGLQNGFLAKYSPNGDYIYAYRISGNLTSDIKNLEIDAASNVYIAGAFNGKMDVDPGPDSTFLISKPFVNESFVCKYNVAGNLCWAKQFTGGTTQEIRFMAMDTETGLYFIGDFTGKTDFNPGSDSVFLPNAGAKDIFVFHLDSAGQFGWAKSFGSKKSDFGTSLRFRAPNRLVTSGYFTDTIDFDPGPGNNFRISKGNIDGYVMEMTTEGNIAWLQTVGGTGGDYIQDINIDNTGNVYASGLFNGGAIDFEPGPGNSSFTPVGSDGFMTKWSATGSFLSVFVLTGLGNQFCNGMYFDNQNNPILYGLFENTLSLNPNPGTFSLVSTGKTDMFIMHIVQNPVAVLPTKTTGGFTVYPNPSTHYIWLQSSFVPLGEIHLYNAIGVDLGKVETDQEGKVDVSGFPSGIYRIRMESAEGIKIQTWVKE